jgi:hypothetical protein
MSIHKFLWSLLAGVETNPLLFVASHKPCRYSYLKELYLHISVETMPTTDCPFKTGATCAPEYNDYLCTNWLYPVLFSGFAGRVGKILGIEFREFLIFSNDQFNIPVQCQEIPPVHLSNPFSNDN